MSKQHEPDRRILRDIAALADGSLAAGRRPRVEAAVREDPQLADILADHRRALAAVDLPGVTAPPALRERVEAMCADAGPGTRARPQRLRVLAAALPMALALIAFALWGGATGAPSVSEAAVLTARPATAPPPMVDTDIPALLERDVGDVAFPNWGPPFGWHAVGQRTDRLDGRDSVTLIYARGAQRLGYTILAGAPLRWPSGSSTSRTVRNGTDVRGLTLDGRETVTWRRGGHTCVMSGERGVSRAELVRLASWRDGGSLVY